MPSLQEIDAAALKGLLDQGRALVVDVREPDEYARERIAGSRLVPLSTFDAGQIPPDNDKTVVLHCKGGMRSAQAGARLLAAGRPSAVHLKGGLDAWKAAGMPVQATAGVPISILRQMQITAGTMILAGSALGWFVSPWFFLLTGFFGAGLLFAGVSGFCGMAALLTVMPWNRVFRPKRCGGCGETCGTT